MHVRTRRAFTLIEMMVAVSIFAIVMLIGVGALLSMVETNRRAEAIHQIMSSLNASVESMARSIRVGSVYHCEETNASQAPATLAQTRDCNQATGGILLAIESSNGDRSSNADQVVYRLNGTKLERSLTSGSLNSWVDLTSPEVTIESFKFYVIGSASGDGIQPRVLITMKGSMTLPRGKTSLLIQTTVVQRLIDI